MNDILTPNILHSIIICSTIVILSVIAVSAYRIRKVENRRITLKEDKIKVKDGYALGSYIFLSSIVVLIGIVIFSYSFYAQESVLDFMSLASALVSIILAVVTIIYSFVTNTHTAGQFDKFGNAVDHVNENVENLQVTAAELQKVTDKVDRTTESYMNSADLLKDNIQRIIVAISNVSLKADEILLGLDNSKSSSGSVPSTSNSKLFIENYVNTSSWVGIMVMYLCSEAYKQDVKKIELKEIFDDVDVMSYCCGFLVAATSAGLLRTSIKFNEKQVEILNCDELTTNAINHWLESVELDEMPPIKELRDKIDVYLKAKSKGCAK